MAEQRRPMAGNRRFSAVVAVLAAVLVLLFHLVGLARVRSLASRTRGSALVAGRIAEAVDTHVRRVLTVEALSIPFL